MPRDINPKQPLEGFLQESYISFNIKRSHRNYSKFPRRVTLLPGSSPKKTIVPGIKENGEGQLARELKKHQNWKQVERFSSQINPHMFSFLWRFRKRGRFVTEEVRGLKGLGKKDAKKSLAVFKKYQSALSANFSPGQVYLFPDAEVTFQNPNRVRDGYARSVLVVDVRRTILWSLSFRAKGSNRYSCRKECWESVRNGIENL